MLYTSLDTQIVDAINAAFKQKYGIEVQYFRGGSSDVTSKVLAEADAGRPQVDMVDASDLAALLLMKERGLLKPFKSHGHGRGGQGAARSRRHLDHRSADAGGHSVQHQGIRLGAAGDLGRSRQGRHERPPGLLLQRQRRRRAAHLYPRQASGLGRGEGDGGHQAAARADAAGHHPGARARRARRRLPAERQHRLALQAAGQADRLRVSRRRACRPRSAPAAC